MGFFSVAQEPKKAASRKETSLEMLHKLECKVCPLREYHSQLTHPDMKPHGTTEPLVYMLGEAPGKDEDKRGKPFVGKAGNILRLRIPKEFDDTVLRWNNCVRTRPPNNRTPVRDEIECCRPSVERDIEATKPKAIFGFGNVPLLWALGMGGGIMKWNGRRIPIKVGSHSCWYYPMIHPSFVGRTQRFENSNAGKYASETEFVFAMDLARAFAQVEDLPEAFVHDADYALDGIQWVEGNSWDDVDTIIENLEHFSAQNIVGLDYETNAVRPYAKGAKILTVGLSSKERTFAFPLYHKGAKWSEKQIDTIEKAFEDFLYDAKCRKVVHNLAFEQEWSGFFYGKDVIRAGSWGCSAAQAFILDERIKKGKPDCLSLEFLCIQHFGINIKKLANVNRKDLDAVPLTDVLRYQGLDAKYHRLLYNAQHKRLKEEKLHSVYQEHLRRIPTMVLTQLKGFPTDQKQVKAFHNEYLDRRLDIEDELADMKAVREFRKITGRAFNPGSTPDVKAVLKQQGIQLELTKAKGDKSRELKEHVDEAVLSKIKHPIADTIIRWRKATKILGTYIYPVVGHKLALELQQEYPDQEIEASPHIWPDGLAHCITTTMQTRTWRTSAEDFNYQNWPKRQQKEIRKQIAARKGWKIVSFDYGQIQARNVAMESHDAALVKAFWDRYDIHHDWTERLIKIYPKWMDQKGGVKAALKDKAVWKWFRDKMKNEFVFPCFFGAIAKSQANYLGVPDYVTEQLHEQFWDMFPNIKDWHKRIAADYKRVGYVTGHSGFRRRAPISPNEMINAPIQADEAIIVIDAMTRLSETDHDLLQANMEIHDDLTFHWPEEKVEELAEIVVEKMINVPYKWAHVVPIVVEMSMGDNWADKKDVGVFASDTYKGHLDVDQGTRDEVGLGSWDDGTGWANTNRGEKGTR